MAASVATLKGVLPRRKATTCGGGLSSSTASVSPLQSIFRKHCLGIQFGKYEHFYHPPPPQSQVVHQPPIFAGGHEVVRRQQPEQGAEATLQVLPPGSGPARALPHCAGLRQVPGGYAQKRPLKCFFFLNSLFYFQALKPHYFTLSPSDMKLLNHVRVQHVSNFFVIIF